MKTYKQKNIEFFRRKSELIEFKLASNNIKYPVGILPYAVKEDFEDMESWTEREHERYYAFLRLYVLYYRGEGLNAVLCSFCLKYLGFTKCNPQIIPKITQCFDYCAYGKRHKICSSNFELSTWKFVNSKVEISNEEYQKIIQKIEENENETPN